MALTYTASVNLLLLTINYPSLRRHLLMRHHPSVRMQIPKPGFDLVAGRVYTSSSRNTWVTDLRLQPDVFISNIMVSTSSATLVQDCEDLDFLPSVA
jgi:hypothetical protein